MSQIDPSAVSLAVRIDIVCNRFEAASRAGVPRIEDFLSGWQGQERQTLLGELVALDLDYRRRRGEDATWQQYACRFPELPPEGMAVAAVQTRSDRPMPDLPARRSLTEFLAPSQADDELGWLGKYRILKILGHGGMGVVFQAEDPRLRRKVAVKAMLPALAANDGAGKRFLQEAQATAAVEHDHIVRIHQVDEERGTPFIVMEFLKGEPLDERLRREGKLPLEEVLRIGREIAEALGAAHATGLIHRDVKPANIWLEAPRGRVKILDFGLARAASQQDAGPAGEETAVVTPTYAASGLTQEGAIIGTPAYMSPEQARGQTVDSRCDLFSLGVVLYRICTGQQPFAGKDNVSTLLAVASDRPPSPVQLDAGMPQELSDLVMQLLEKDPQRRPASAGEVVQRLEGLQRKPTAGRTRTAVMLGLCLLALMPLGWWLATVISRMETDKGTLAGKIDNADAASGIKWDGPDRKAAEWVLSIGGTVGVNGQDRSIKAAADLPRDAFQLTHVNLHSNIHVSDAGLAHFKDCKNLVSLGLNDTQVSDAGLAHFKDCKNLTALGLVLQRYVK